MDNQPNHRIRVRAELMDGDDLRAVEATSRTYMCTADRVAFERRFGQSSGALASLRDKFDEQGKPRPGADLSDLRDEWIAFFAWRVLNRHAGDQGDFDSWIERVADIELEDLDDRPEVTSGDAPTEVGDPDPLAEAAPVGS